ncbi:MAG TPA: tetratricopeptide repeat protein, partial [Terriglobales bacterium]|nr:tetratricopeptide repeat protein [Terriglobales bacterium]
MERADRYFKAGDFDKAKVEYLNLLRIDHQSIIPVQQIGYIWLEQGVPLRAVPFLTRVRELAPQNTTARTKLASAYMALGDFADARKEALAVLKQDPTRSDCLIIATDTAQTKEEIAEAEQWLDKFPNKNTAAFHLAAASLATRKGEASSAAEQMQQALVAEPNSARAHLLTGYFYFVRSNPSHAESELKAAADLAPARSEEKIKYAEFKAANGGVEEAKTILTGITKAAPDYVPAWRDLAQIALTEKKYDEGLSSLENILSRDADNPEARLLQATFFMAKGDEAKAVA